MRASGSRGKPKGATFTHRIISVMADSMTKHHNFFHIECHLRNVYITTTIIHHKLWDVSMKSLFLIITFAVVMLFAHSYVPAQSKSTQSEKGTQKEAEQKEKAKSTDDMPPPPPGETGQEPSKEKSADKIVGKTPDGKNVYQGPKGGMYTINAKGDKAYLDADQKQKVVPLMKEGDKIVGKTEDGKPIYEGPKGGRYTLNAKGEKVYLKK